MLNEAGDSLAPMRLALTPHPDCPPGPVARIEAALARPRPGALALRYAASGAVSGLRIPAPAAPARAEGLWRRTCFEAFVRAAGAQSYYEFNFSPSSQWAAYAFDDYRSGMRAAEIAQPRIGCVATGDALAVTVELDLGALPGLGGALSIALSAVMEEEGGALSYWALAHAPGKPDFHHAAGFVVELA